MFQDDSDNSDVEDNISPQVVIAFFLYNLYNSKGEPIFLGLTFLLGKKSQGLHNFCPLLLICSQKRDHVFWPTRE